MTEQPVHGEHILWRPGPDASVGPMGRFLQRVSHETGRDLTDYRAALEWSTTEIGQFWDQVRREFDIVGDWPGAPLTDDRMPGAVWFPDAWLNLAEHLLRHANGPLANEIAIVDLDEPAGELGEPGSGGARNGGAGTGGRTNSIVRTITWAEVAGQVGALAAALRERGVVAGDRVAAVLPNVPEAIVALLATASLGATWCVCSPDLSATAALSRLTQLDPKVLIGSLGYRFNGTWLDRREHLDEVLAGLPTVEHVIEVGPEPARTSFDDLVAESVTPTFERVPFDHPLWVLFTSGTTGAPKGIVHGHGGMTLESVKMFGLHYEMTERDRYYVAANTSWMVWNTIIFSLMTGASVVTYAGSPLAPRVDRQFEILAETGATMFGTGAAYLQRVQDEGRRPADDFDLSALRVVLSTGSTLADSTSLWFHEAVRPGVRLSDTSGGTDICSAFVGGNPLEPVRLGRMQGALLGVALDVFDESGTPVRDEVGELVIARPMPPMPVRFWGDDDGSRYRSAYFEGFDGVWTHGDWMTLADDGTCEILGRSDATLNRGGVRLGSAEVYSALQGLVGVRDALTIGVDVPGGGYYMPLFVVPDEGTELDDALRDRIVAAIRTHASARHVPDEIIAAPAIPTTHAGKKIEVPVKKLFSGADPSAVDRGSLANPDALDWFIERAHAFRAERE